jgi:hypothetical protein
MKPDNWQWHAMLTPAYRSATGRQKGQRLIEKSMSSTSIGDGYRFLAFAKPASAGEGRSDKIKRKQR